MKKRLSPILAIILLSLFACFSARGVGFDRINVTAYGAVPNDGADDTAAINTALTKGQSIYFPAGTYNYNGSMILQGSLAGKPFRFYGEGPGVSTIIFTNASSGGINAPSMGQNSLVVEGLTLQANSSGCATAIDATFGNGVYRAATIHNVQIKGTSTDGTNGTSWSNGIHLVGATHSVLDKVEITGNTATTTGIWFEPPGGSPPQAATGFNMSNIQVKWCNTALRTTGHIEGVYLTGFEFTSCGRGGLPAVDLNVTTLAQGGAFHLVNGTIDMIGDGLVLTKPSFAKISNVRFVHNAPGATVSNMLKISDGFNVTVSQCSFYGGDANGPGENGITGLNTTSLQLNGNNFNHMLAPGLGTGVVVWGECPGLRITDNLFTDFGHGQYWVAVTGTPAPYYCGNYPSTSNVCGNNP
ncbi:MAG TPA: glycosyl hydrolase family 28-related protein [Chthoniobacterales bacterium]|nr:glycosyl hydrolase family 28-related protein [Chthoniobacterales bacterium]